MRGVPNPVSTGVFNYVPKNLDMRQLGGAAQRVENECYWLIWRLISRDQQKRYSHDDWIEVPQRDLEAFIHPRKVSQVKSTLIGNGVMECDQRYLAADVAPDGEGYSMSYRIAEAYKGSLKRVEITNRAMANRILAYRMQFEGKPISGEELGQTHRHLYNWLRQTRIDTEGAYRAVDKRAAQRMPNARKSLVEYYKAINRMTIDRIASGEWEFSICRFRRVHTNVTHLLSAARKQLSINGEPLVNLDIRNSQIVFFTAMMKEHYSLIEASSKTRNLLIGTSPKTNSLDRATNRRPAPECP